MTILIDDFRHEAAADERLIDVVLRAGIELPHVCHHPQLGPIQTCDRMHYNLAVDWTPDRSRYFDRDHEHMSISELKSSDSDSEVRLHNDESGQEE
jgi:hypothetical protein